MPDPLTIGTRGSRLALYQARLVRSLLAERLGLAAELVVLKTQGDRDQSRPVTELGGVGVFVKELERALVAGEVDLAVHSLKDLPTEGPEGLFVVAVPERVGAGEVLVVREEAYDAGAGVLPLRAGARVGTASQRRRAQLLALRPDLEVVGIRGNVPTRVEKARSEVDAVVLAAAGIDRLGLELPAGLRRVDLRPEDLLPAPGQAALAIQVRRGDPRTAPLAALDDAEARARVEAERALLHALGAGCSVPLGAYATATPRGLVLAALYDVSGGAETPRLRRALVRADEPKAAARLALRVLDPPPAAPPASFAGRRVLVARDPDRAAELVETLRAAGAEARWWSPSRRRPLGGDLPLDTALEELPAGGWVVFASVNAVRHAEKLLGEDLARLLAERRIAAVGPGTARALAARGVPVDLVPERASGVGAAEALLARFGPERPPVLLPAARGGRTELSDALRAAGCEVTLLELYESQANDPPPREVLADLDAVVLASPSGARAVLAAPLPEGCRLVAFGESTRAEIESLGRRAAAVAEQPTVAGVLAALAAAFADRGA